MHAETCPLCKGSGKVKQHVGFGTSGTSVYDAACPVCSLWGHPGIVFVPDAPEYTPSEWFLRNRADPNGYSTPIAAKQEV